MNCKNDEPTFLLIVEDDQELADLMKQRLEREGFIVGHEPNGKIACKRILTERPALVVLDLMLPGMDGLDICREIRPKYKGPILILTARDDDLDQVMGLELGADDFVTKPIRPRVLLARIRALLRRIDRSLKDRENKRLTVGPLVIDAATRAASLLGRPIHLTTIEFDLLWYLARKAGNVLSRNAIHLELYGSEHDALDRSIDVYISRIRQKLEDDPGIPKFLKTVRGVGYLLAEQVE